MFERFVLVVLPLSLRQSVDVLVRPVHHLPLTDLAQPLSLDGKLVIKFFSKTYGASSDEIALLGAHMGHEVIMQNIIPQEITSGPCRSFSLLLLLSN